MKISSQSLADNSQHSMYVSFDVKQLEKENVLRAMMVYFPLAIKMTFELGAIGNQNTGDSKLPWSQKLEAGRNNDSSHPRQSAARGGQSCAYGLS